MKPDAVPSEDRKAQIMATAVYQSGEWFNRSDLDAVFGTRGSTLNTVLGYMIDRDGTLERQKRWVPSANTHHIFYRRRTPQINWLTKSWRLFSNEFITGEAEYAR